MAEPTIKTDNTIEIIEKLIYYITGNTPMPMCNQIANRILNEFDANGFEVIKTLDVILKDTMIELMALSMASQESGLVYAAPEERVRRICEPFLEQATDRITAKLENREGI